MKNKNKLSLRSEPNTSVALVALLAKEGRKSKIQNPKSKIRLPPFHPERFPGSELATPSHKGPTPVSLTPCFSKVRQPLRDPSTVSTVSRVGGGLTPPSDHIRVNPTKSE
jgi:hypothetical protein